jgi:hypothetical protein
MKTGYVERQILEDTPQDFTLGWVDLGPEIDMYGYSKLAAWLTLDINNSTNARIRALAKLDSGGTKEYNLQIKTTGASAISIENEYYEWNVDADAKTFLEIETNGLIPFVQLQIQAGALGATPGQIDYCEITKIGR